MAAHAEVPRISKKITDAPALRRGDGSAQGVASTSGGQHAPDRGIPAGNRGERRNRCDLVVAFVRPRSFNVFDMAEMPLGNEFPTVQPVHSWQDAEVVAAVWMRWLGHRDARKTPSGRMAV